MLSLPVVPGRVMILYLLSPVPHHNAQFLSETSSSTLNIQWTQGARGSTRMNLHFVTIEDERCQQPPDVQCLCLSLMLTLSWLPPMWLKLLRPAALLRPTLIVAGVNDPECQTHTHMYCVYTGQMMLASASLHSPLRPHTGPQPSKRGENSVLCYRRSMGPAAWVTWPIVE